MTLTKQYVAETKQMIDGLDVAAIDRMVRLLADTRAGGGRLFILGVGGSTANASAAVNDFRGRDGGYPPQLAGACVIVPAVNAVNTTPYAEAFQAVVWRPLVSHPKLKQTATRWESVR